MRARLTPLSIATPSATWRPMFIKTTDYGKTWTPLVTPQDAKGVRGYAHVIKEDLVQPNLLFLGTEFGLFVSIDGGQVVGAIQGQPFPGRGGARPRHSAADERSRPRHARPRHLDHRRHHAAARAHARLLTQGSQLCRREAGAAATHREQRRLAERRRHFHRRQSARRRGHHLLPKIASPLRQTEDRSPRCHRPSDRQLPASKRPGLNRVIWSMREKPPRVPPAAQIAVRRHHAARAFCPAPTPCA